MQPKQPNSPIIVCASDELIVTVVVLRLREKIMVVFIAPHRYIASPHVPKLDGLVMASHEIALFVRVVIHTEDLISALLAGFYHVLVAEWRNGYLLDFLSQMWTSLPLFAQVRYQWIGSTTTEVMLELLLTHPFFLFFYRSNSQMVLSPHRQHSFSSFLKTIPLILSSCSCNPSRMGSSVPMFKGETTYNLQFPSLMMAK